MHFMSRRFRSVVDWGLGFGCRFGPMRLLLGLLGFWSRQLLSGSGNPRCAVDSAPSAQLLSRLNRSHQPSPFGRALAPVRQQQVSAGYSYPPQLNQPPLRCSQPLQLPTSAGLICLLHLHSSSARPPAVRERYHPRLRLTAASASSRPRFHPPTAPPPAPPRHSSAFLSCPSQLDLPRLASSR